MKQTPFKINPNLRLKTAHFEIKWVCVDQQTLTDEQQYQESGRYLYPPKGQCQAMVQVLSGICTIYYCEAINFESLRWQRWSRKMLRDIITDVATPILCQRLHELEAQHHLKCRSVKVKKLRKRTLGLCSFYNDISLSPRIFLFPQRYTDMVILHELTHIHHKHHRKSFWQALTKFLGVDANALDVQMSFDMNHSLAYSEYLMQ